MYTVLLVGHVLLAVTIIGLVLLQHGKGADMGAAFGSGASSTVFGSRGATSFLAKVTGFLAAGFFLTSLVLAMLTGREEGPGSVMQQQTPVQQEQAAPAPSAPPAPQQGEQGAPPAPPAGGQ